MSEKSDFEVVRKKWDSMASKFTDQKLKDVLSSIIDGFAEYVENKDGFSSFENFDLKLDVIQNTIDLMNSISDGIAITKDVPDQTNDEVSSYVRELIDDPSYSNLVEEGKLVILGQSNTEIERWADEFQKVFEEDQRDQRVIFIFDKQNRDEALMFKLAL